MTLTISSLLWLPTRPLPFYRDIATSEGRHAPFQVRSSSVFYPARILDHLVTCMPSPGGTAPHRLPLLVAALFNSYQRTTPTTSYPRCVPAQPWALAGRGERDKVQPSEPALAIALSVRVQGSACRWLVPRDTNTGYTPLCSRVPIRRGSWLISPKKVGYSVRHLMYMGVRVLGC